MKRTLSPIVVCPICQRRIEGIGSTVCSECVDELRSEVGPYSTTIHSGERAVPCLIAAEYGGRVKRAIEVVKFSANRRVAHVVGEILMQPLLPRLIGEPLSSSTAIVPIPASVTGRLRRGFDQTLVIAGKRGVPVACLLKRKRGVQQKTLDKTGRSENAIFQHGIGPYRVVNRYRDTQVIVVDDVMTTGASIRTCINVLQEEGISVYGAAVCAAAR